jgi:hypothetical protein
VNRLLLVILHHQSGLYWDLTLSKEVYSPAVIQGQQRMKNATSRASKCACTKASMSMVMAAQRYCKLASAQPPYPPQHPATSAPWHHKNDLALPDHLQTESCSTPQQVGLAGKNMPTKAIGTPVKIGLCPQMKMSEHSEPRRPCAKELHSWRRRPD